MSEMRERRTDTTFMRMTVAKIQSLHRNAKAALARRGIFIKYSKSGSPRFFYKKNGRYTKAIPRLDTDGVRRVYAHKDLIIKVDVYHRSKEHLTNNFGWKSYSWEGNFQARVETKNLLKIRKTDQAYFAKLLGADIRATSHNFIVVKRERKMKEMRSIHLPFKAFEKVMDIVDRLRDRYNLSDINDSGHNIGIIGKGNNLVPFLYDLGFSDNW